MQNLFGIVNKPRKEQPQKDNLPKFPFLSPVPSHQYFCLDSDNFESQIFTLGRLLREQKGGLNSIPCSSSLQPQPPLPPPSSGLPPATLARYRQQAFGSSAD
jgi:hypothetical protein